MKKLIALIPLFIVLSLLETNAQDNTPGIDKREQIQHKRIRQGVASGEVTRPEAVRLRTEQRHIRRTERRAKADGVVTPSEKTRIEHKQNRASRDIRKQKHDSQQRPKTH